MTVGFRLMENWVHAHDSRVARNKGSTNKKSFLDKIFFLRKSTESLPTQILQFFKITILQCPCVEKAVANVHTDQNTSAPLLKNYSGLHGPLSEQWVTLPYLKFQIKEHSSNQSIIPLRDCDFTFRKLLYW